jgi:hypothetical protein
MRDRPRRAASGTAGSADALEEFRGHLLADLPGLLAKAIDGYARYAADCPSDDPKAFIAYQTGCRAALTHIHLLVTLARWARPAPGEGAPGFDAEQLDHLVRQAEAALRREDGEPD